MPEQRIPEHQPHRGSDVEAWIKRHRDEHGNLSANYPTDEWRAIDNMLDDYREHADTGTPLDREVEGPHHNA